MQVVVLSPLIERHTHMAFMDRISIIIDAKVEGFTSGLKKIKTDIAEADGLVGKFKAGFSGLAAGVKANAGMIATVAGGALVEFGRRSIGAFQDSALAAGKFADATGQSVESASRWIEVAGDIGVSADALQGAFQKMNKSIADGKASWTEYGIEIVKTGDGVVDANATFQNALTTIGAIADPMLRAKAAQEVFGKSYGEVAELMEMSAEDLKKALEGVGDAQVIDEKELAKAKKCSARRWTRFPTRCRVCRSRPVKRSSVS